MKSLPAINLFRIILYMFATCTYLLTASVFAATSDDASKYIEAIGNNAVEIISDKNLSKENKQKKIEVLFRKNIDIPWVGRFVLGRFWRQVNEEQKKKYLKEYEMFLIRHYASRFADYTGGSFKITGAYDDGEDEFTVNMQIQPDNSGGDPISVDYRVRTIDQEYKNSFIIFDIIVEGVSMITTQRSEFTSVITNKGMDYLIMQLTTKI